MLDLLSHQPLRSSIIHSPPLFPFSFFALPQGPYESQSVVVVRVDMFGRVFEQSIAEAVVRVCYPVRFQNLITPLKLVRPCVMS